MNSHSFISVMAKLIDESKLHRIKEAAVELTVQEGYGGASIAAIARKANVAAGYLYRFYAGKYELVSDLLDETIRGITGQIEETLTHCSSIREVIEPLVQYFFDLAAADPHRVRFVYSLINDYRFSIQPQQLQHIQSLCSRVALLGRVRGEVDAGFREEEIYLMAVIYPIEFINIRFKQLFAQEPLKESDRQRVVELIMASLRGSANRKDSNASI